MVIDVAGNPAVIQGLDVEFELGDAGSANVFMVFGIDGQDAIEHAEPDEGARKKTVKFPKKGLYGCNLYVAAHTYKSFGKDYDASVTANGAPIAWTKGNVPSGKKSDRKFRSFQIRVT